MLLISFSSHGSSAYAMILSLSVDERVGEGLSGERGGGYLYEMISSYTDNAHVWMRGWHTAVFRQRQVHAALPHQVEHLALVKLVCLAPITHC